MKYILILLSLLLCGCTSTPQDYKNVLTQWKIENYTSEGFDHCKGYGCRLMDHVIFDAHAWTQIDQIFIPPSENAREEQQRIGYSIGLFERIVGPITGTETDVHGTFYALGDDQLDCVDESINTTIYLALLKERGHLMFHDLNAPTARPPFLSGNPWWHQAAVIRETETQTGYVVDSWFEDNGAPAHIVPLKEWMHRWFPKKSGFEE